MKLIVLVTTVVVVSTKVNTKVSTKVNTKKWITVNDTDLNSISPKDQAGWDKFQSLYRQCVGKSGTFKFSYFSKGNITKTYQLKHKTSTIFAVWIFFFGSLRIFILIIFLLGTI